MKRLWALRSIISRAGIALLLAIFAYALLWLVRWLFFGRFPFNTLPVFLSLWALSYIVISGLIWARKKLSWSLRNQMAAVYIFIAVVPVLLVVTMVGLGAYLLYWQLGSYVLYTEMQTRVQRVATVAGGLATTLAIEATATGRPVPTLPIPTQTQGFLESAKADIPGLQVEIGTGAGADRADRIGRGDWIQGDRVDWKAARSAGGSSPSSARRQGGRFRLRANNARIVGNAGSRTRSYTLFDPAASRRQFRSWRNCHSQRPEADGGRADRYRAPLRAACGQCVR